MQEMGLNLENCEQWFERAVVAFVVLMLIVIVVRVSPAARPPSPTHLVLISRFIFFLQLHFVLAISHYYSQLTRHHGSSLPVFLRSHHKDTTGLQRIYLLPSPTSATSFNTQGTQPEIVYAPVPLRDLSEQDARELNAREAWIRTSSSPQPPRTHRHSRSHSHPHRHHTTGRIGLPIRPNEGLLPGHEKILKD